jgi:DNA topoisomerase I
MPLVGLRYVTDNTPGIRRVRAGKGFRYLDAQGRTVRNAETLIRIRSLAIPPAWENVWICPADNGHLQATGRDARGRKQYRYHPEWRAKQEETKYERMTAFAGALDAIRRRTRLDLARPGLPREKVLAALVQLLEKTLIRVGNEEYARDNGSFGLTTFRNRHVKVNGSRVSFRFRGKSGKEHEIGLDDPRLAAIVRRCRDLPGQELFAYVDDDGNVRDIGSSDVNDYLREITGEDFTAKDFRTWAGTVLAARALKEYLDFDSPTAAKRNVNVAVEAVASVLGNTKAVCRKSYIHPKVIDCYMEGKLPKLLTGRRRVRLKGLRPDEAGVVKLLGWRSGRDSNPRPPA